MSTLDLRIAPVAKRLGDATVRMLAYNGSIPGPILKVQEGSEVIVDVENQGDMDATVHWHGLRLENRYDGTHETQAPMAVGERFSARVTFPDPGVYWYHPHIREDYGQEMGLYGNVLVEPADPDYWPPVHRELVLTLDDILLEDGKVAPFSRSETTYAAMGRFGDVLLVSGEPDLALTAQLGEVVRLYLTNTANTRVFKVKLPGARMKLVGGDSGHVEHEQFVEDGDPRSVRASHRRCPVRPRRRARAGAPHAGPGLSAGRDHRQRGARPSRHSRSSSRSCAPIPTWRPSVSASRRIWRPSRTRPWRSSPRWTWTRRRATGRSSTRARCTRRSYEEAGAAVVSEQPGHCPDCGMKLLPAQLVAEAGGHEHEGHAHGEHEHAGHDHAAAGGIEWEDDMVAVNRLTTPANMRWKIIDRETDAENAAIDWQFRVGDQVKIRLLNEMAGDHPMHHPFHVHGAGRFLVLARDDVAEPNLVWKDTVLVRTGETVDILLDVTNVGRWMAHCHIAEHHESGMMFSFDVRPTP